MRFSFFLQEAQLLTKYNNIYPSYSSGTRRVLSEAPGFYLKLK